MVVAYQVGQARQKGLQTIYQQHARYMARHNIPGSPRSLFQDDITAAITRWIAKGDRIILFVDMNEHILTGALPRKLMNLGLQEATHTYWGETEPHTYVQGDRDGKRALHPPLCDGPKSWSVGYPLTQRVLLHSQ
jgi:hypothetical protein